MGKSFTMSPQAAARPNGVPVTARYTNTGTYGVVYDNEVKGYLVLESLLRETSEDVIALIRHANKSGVPVRYDDTGYSESGYPDILLDTKGNPVVLDRNRLKERAVAQFLRKLTREGKRIIHPEKLVTPHDSEPQAVTAASAPAEEVVVSAPAATVEPVQDAPEVDMLPDLPAAPVASAPATPAPAVAQAAPVQEAPTNGETPGWWAKIPIDLRMIGGSWAVMLVLFSIAFPGAWIFASMAALTGIAVIGWKVCQLAPNWAVFIMAVWAIVTHWFIGPVVGFVADNLLPMDTAAVVGPMTWLGTATIVWVVLAAKKAVLK